MSKGPEPASSVGIEDLAARRLISAQDYNELRVAARTA